MQKQENLAKTAGPQASVHYYIFTGRCNDKNKHTQIHTIKSPLLLLFLLRCKFKGLVIMCLLPSRNEMWIIFFAVYQLICLSTLCISLQFITTSLKINRCNFACLYISWYVIMCPLNDKNVLQKMGF